MGRVANDLQNCSGKDDNAFRELLDSDYDPNCEFCYDKIKKRVVA